MVDTKVAIQVEAKKKEALDKNLDLILGQTEKYSKMLAANLVAVEEEEEGPKKQSKTPGKTPPPAAAAGEAGPVGWAVRGMVCDGGVLRWISRELEVWRLMQWGQAQSFGICGQASAGKQVVMRCVAGAGKQMVCKAELGDDHALPWFLVPGLL